MRWSVTSLTGKFVALSLVTIALITTAQILVQWTLLRDDLLDWETMSTAPVIQTEAYALLRAEDFVDWTSLRSRERFDAFFGWALSNPEISNARLYDAGARLVWSANPALVGTHAPDDALLARALRGETIARLPRIDQVELYVPLTFSRGSTPGTASVGGAVYLAKDPARMFANLARDRWAMLATSLGGAVLLYTALFGIVLRASRQLTRQRRDLDRQADALAASDRDLRATRDQLRISERLAAVGEVTAGVAHGIRNPLANIRASAEVALDVPDDRALVTKYLETIVAEVDRVSRWLSGLLDVARPFEPRPTRVQLNSVVTDLCELFAERCAARGITLRCSLAEDLPFVSADAPQLEQALSTVMENAIEALHEGGTLELWTETTAGARGRAVTLVIRDDGQGIPPESLERVFEPFFTTKRGGTGLGLPVARKIIEAHGGRITIDSAPGRGTAVTIVLPARQEDG